MSCIDSDYRYIGYWQIGSARDLEAAAADLADKTLWQYQVGVIASGASQSSDDVHARYI
jgi:hypothetical protein